MSQRSIALVEDDAVIRENYADVLRSEGFDVRGYDSEASAREAFTCNLPDLALLDIQLLDRRDGGYALCSWLRHRSQSLPIIFLTSLRGEADKISGLRLGADDYITKDNSIDYVVIRIHALFRRLDALSQVPSESVLRFDSLTLNDSVLLAYWCDRSLDLSLTQYWMLKALVSQAGEVLSHKQLMQAANVQVEPNTVVAHIKAIRRKFLEIDPGFNAIRTARGNGYCWSPAKLSDSTS